MPRGGYRKISKGKLTDLSPLSPGKISGKKLQRGTKVKIIPFLGFGKFLNLALPSARQSGISVYNSFQQ
jgi:hypothetical protein